MTHKTYQNRTNKGTRKARQLAFAFLAPGYLGSKPNTAVAATAASPPLAPRPHKAKASDGAPRGSQEQPENDDKT